MTWHPGIPTEYRNAVVTGDARELSRRLPDASVDLVLTDPPFGIGFAYSNGYEDRPEGYEDLVRWIVAESERVLRPGGFAFVYQSMSRLRETWQWFPQHSQVFAGCKTFVQLNRGAIPNAFDPVIYWRKDGGPKVRPLFRDWHVADTANMQASGLKAVPRATFHSCPRPASTVLFLMECCPPGGVVCDFFMGSATTAAAAKLAGRNYVGFEIDADTAAATRQRIGTIPLPMLFPDPPAPLSLFDEVPV